MIEPSKGREDLEYRYHVSIETWALLSAEQQERYRHGPDCNYLKDPNFHSEYPDLQWVAVEKLSFTEPDAESAGRHAREKLGSSLNSGKWWYHMRPVLYIQGDVLCRGLVLVLHQARVPKQEWKKEETE